MPKLPVLKKDTIETTENAAITKRLHKWFIVFSLQPSDQNKKSSGVKTTKTNQLKKKHLF